MDKQESMARWAKFDKKMIDDIEREGWSDIGVFPTEDSQGLPFNYTVGLSVTSEHPELLIMGMPNQQNHMVLCMVVDQIQGGTRFGPNTYSTEVIKELRVAFVAIDDPFNDDYPMSMAKVIEDGITALQVVWPDEHDRFPWDDDFDPAFAGRQVLLGTWTEPVDD